MLTINDDQIPSLVKEHIFLDPVLKSRARLEDLLGQIGALKNLRNRKDLIKIAKNVSDEIEDLSRTQVECRQLGRKSGRHQKALINVEEQFVNIESLLITAILMDD